MHPIDLAHLYILYLFSYLFIVSWWYSRAARMGITAENMPRPVIVFIFIMGGPAIWLAYPCTYMRKARRVNDGRF